MWLCGFPAESSLAGTPGRRYRDVMAAAPSVDGFEARARTLLDTRMDAVRKGARTQGALAEAREALLAAERAHADAYAAAEKAGWTTDELRKVGLDTPTRRRPGRPRRSTPPPAASASSADE